MIFHQEFRNSRRNRMNLSYYFRGLLKTRLQYGLSNQGVLKVSRSFKRNPANTPRVFLVERIWKRRFPRFFKVKYACYICREESNGNKGGNFTLPLSVLILWLNLCVSDAVINDEKNTHKLYTKKVFSMNDSFSGCEQVHSIIWSCFKLTVKLQILWCGKRLIIFLNCSNPYNWY